MMWSDGKMYNVRVESHTVFRYHIHEDWRSIVFEQVSTYDVNGVKGYGIFEFLYRFVSSGDLKLQFCGLAILVSVWCIIFVLHKSLPVCSLPISYCHCHNVMARKILI